MDFLGNVPLLLGSSWASGVNLYLTIAVLGISQRFGWITLPGDMQVLSNFFIIGLALALYAIEFVADKVPFVDSVWDSFHTFIRPLGGAGLGFLATANGGPVVQTSVALLTGAIAMDSHLTKATARAAINSSPEPVSNSVASVTEDISVVGIFYLILQYPIIAALVVILFIIFSIWFLKKMFHFLKRVFQRPPRKKRPNNEKSRYIAYFLFG